MNKKKVSVSIFFIILLLAIPPAFQFQPAFAENNIRQIIRIAENYPAGVSSVSYDIDPPLENIDKSFVFYTVSHVSENDASDTFKSVEIVDEKTVRVIGENTASGNNAIDIIIVIVEFDSDSDIDVQHLKASLAGSSGSQQFSMGAVNTTNSFLIDRGHTINASSTAIGNNDFNRLRIFDTDSWEVNINTAPTTPSNQFVSIVDMNQSDISVQTGLHTLTGTSATRTGGVDFTAIDPDRTMLLVSYTASGGSSLINRQMLLKASLTSGGDITFFRESSSNDLAISWTLIEFPADFAKVTHFETLLTGTLVDVTVPEIQDLDKAFAMSHVSSPFGHSTGSNRDDEDFGSIDRGQAIFSVRSNTVVGVQRDDSTEDSNFGWQLVEFLEKDEVENPQGTNILRQVVKIEDEYLGSSADEQFFTISPPLLNITKALLFMSTSNTYSGTGTDVSERIKRYEIFNTTTLRITGSNDPDLTNEVMPFVATIVEFDSTSPIKVQRDQIQYSADSSNDARFFEGEFFMHQSPINASGSNIMFQGWSGSQGGSGGVGDFTYGAEEVVKVRIVDGTQWGYEIDNPLDFQQVVGVVTLNDYNQNNIFVQRGESTFSGTSLTVSPPVDVIRNQSLLFASIRSTSNEFDNEPDDLAVLAHLDNSSPPDIIFEKTSTTETIEISWEILSFPLKSLFVQHGIHSQSGGTSNATSTLTRPVQNLTEAFVIGTVNIQNGYSGGKGSLTTPDNFGEVTAKMTLDDSTTARFERGQSVGSFDVGFQVVEFQDNFCEVCLDTTGIVFEPTPPPELDITIFHQLLEWFEPTNSALEGVISDLASGFKLFEVLQRIHNNTYGVDANLTASAEFYEAQYLNITYNKLDDFTGNITTQVRTNFGATTP